MFLFQCLISAKELQITLNNDVLYDTDRYYTHGTVISYLYGVEPKEHWLFNWDTVAKRISVGQYIYTPGDISIPELIEYDRPYAGLLYLDNTSYFKSNNRIRSFSVLVGSVGSMSLAEYAQKTIHKAINSRQPMGWDNQLNNEIILNVALIERNRIYSNRYMELSTYYGSSLGNLNTQLIVGGMIRAGFGKFGDYDLINFEPIPKYSHELYDFNIFFGIEQRVVVHNILLDGNTFSDSHSVNKRYLVSELMYGISYKYRNVKIVYAVNVRSKEFDGQEDNFGFGSLSFVYEW
jgi:lipid A 3-O-deacylase